MEDGEERLPRGWFFIPDPLLRAPGARERPREAELEERPPKVEARRKKGDEKTTEHRGGRCKLRLPSLRLPQFRPCPGVRARSVPRGRVVALARPAGPRGGSPGVPRLLCSARLGLALRCIALRRSAPRCVALRRCVLLRVSVEPVYFALPRFASSRLAWPLHRAASHRVALHCIALH